MAVLGNPVAGSITLVVTTPNGKVGSTVITSQGKPVHYSFPAKFKVGGTYLIEVEPPKGALIRSGGDYTLNVSGDIDFSGAKAVGVNGIVGTYDIVYCQGSIQCPTLVRFSKDGTVSAADGSTGTWTVFDPDQLIYVVKLAGYSYDVKLSPGRGLVDSRNGSIEFQAH